MGRGIDLYLLKWKKGGKASLKVDGISLGANTFSPKRKDLRKSLAGLASGKHTVVITALGKKSKQSQGILVVLRRYRVLG